MEAVPAAGSRGERRRYRAHKRGRIRATRDAIALDQDAVERPVATIKKLTVTT
ncbi:hypothetical protein KEC55_12215 [Burkholderia cepacia]|uniref:hypothetical protein n=1 Tax=Burkholderia cepacia TaxID=292 RepID=UPI00249DDAC7|nr:hypothetical protein [Burkholderia cepacia]WGY67605.1 hypothetical protein KEC55_12215 [Burkholderia cepacia]